jgi:exopolyphosphatase / guanosine-5'-triphosphate,3'-diphosphate pyrophosphatase
MNIASIDIGSNTVLLLIASIENGKLIPIVNEYRSPRLGKGLKIGGEILDDRIDDLLEILADYKTLFVQYKCKKIIITATNAIRIASNSDKIIKRIDKELGIKVIIIPGDEEAKLSYLGASSSIPSLEEKIVIDIGGGSTEVIYGNNSDILFKKSFQTGVVSLTEKFLSDYPYSNKALKNVENHLVKTFSLVSEKIPPDISTIAVAGTPTTLSCIKQNLKIYDEIKVESSILYKRDLEVLYNNLSKMSGTEIKEEYGEVVSGREDVLFSGLLILQHFMKLIVIDRIYISSRGIRYGNIINYMNCLK